MARNTATLPASNVFKPASTTIEASAIMAEQLAAYESLLRTLQNPTIYEPLRENDLNQIRQLIATLASQLQTWLGLNPNA